MFRIGSIGAGPRAKFGRKTTEHTRKVTYYSLVSLLSAAESTSSTGPLRPRGGVPGEGPGRPVTGNYWPAVTGRPEDRRTWSGSSQPSRTFSARAHAYCLLLSAWLQTFSLLPRTAECYLNQTQRGPTLGFHENLDGPLWILGFGESWKQANCSTPDLWLDQSISTLRPSLPGSGSGLRSDTVGFRIWPPL